LSTTLLESELASRQASLNQAEAESVNAHLALDRAKSIAARSLLSQADLDQLQSAATSAKARVDAARAELTTAQTRLEFASVRAPDDGVVTARNATVGQLAQSGAELLRLLRQNRVEWRGEVPESALP